MTKPSRIPYGRGARNPLSHAVIITIESALREALSQEALERLTRKLIRNWPGMRRPVLRQRYIAALVAANHRLVALRDRGLPIQPGADL